MNSLISDIAPRESLSTRRSPLLWVLPVTAVSVFTVWAITSGGGLTPLAALDPPARGALSVYAASFYLAMIFWPSRLSPLYELVLPVAQLPPLSSHFSAAMLSAPSL